MEQISPYNRHPAAKASPLTVWFDGACPLCRREMALMRRLDHQKRIVFIDLTGETSDCPIDREALLARFHALEDGIMRSGAPAFAAMWRAIRLLRPFGLMARNQTMLIILDNLYTHFLKVRPTLRRWLS